MLEGNTILKKKSCIQEVGGELEIPSGNDPFQNAWLTLTLRYGLTFLDSRVRGSDGYPDLIVKNKDGEYCARDLNDYLFPIFDWDLASITKFVKYFEMGQGIWNRKFLIIPPNDFDALDYASPAFPGYVMRPNILCLFRMTNNIAGSRSRNFNVVRLNPEVFEDPKYEVPNYRTKDTKRAREGFRSHERLLADRDVLNENLGHELGHALNEKHILALKGDAQCKIDENLQRCYGLTREELANIMGVGKEITKINAGPWLEHLQVIIGCDPMYCTLVMLTDPNVQPLPPRRIQLAKPKPAFAGRR
jgi:hypothetical protein